MAGERLLLTGTVTAVSNNSCQPLSKGKNSNTIQGSFKSSKIRLVVTVCIGANLPTHTTPTTPSSHTHTVSGFWESLIQ